LQWIPLKKRNDRLNEIAPLSHTISVHVFLVVVVSLVDADTTNPKELHEHVKTIDAFRALRHRKLMCHLETSFVTSPIASMRLTDEVD
jgi:hypothetical protein